LRVGHEGLGGTTITVPYADSKTRNLRNERRDSALPKGDEGTGKTPAAEGDQSANLLMRKG
jgi:hypothetical protein